VVSMTTSSRQQRPNRRRSLRKFVVDWVRATPGLTRAAVKRIGSIGRVRVRAPRRAGAIGKDAQEGRRSLRDRSVGRIRHLVGRSVTTTRSVPAQAGRQPAGAIRTGAAADEPVDRAAERRVPAAGGTTPTERHQGEVKPAKARVRTSRTRGRQATARQAKPRQARRDRDLGQHTVQELREQARQAGIEGRASMTKDQLIKALQTASTRGQTATGPYEQRTVQELREQARQAGIEGRASMTKDQLIKALRGRR
jgi:hypothetical protein